MSEFLSKLDTDLPAYPRLAKTTKSASTAKGEISGARDRPKIKLEDVERWTMVKRIW